MFTGLCIGVIAIMRFWPETPLARTLHHHLVERPASWFSTLSREHLIYAIVLVAVLLMFGEVIAVFGTADLAFAYAWDLSLYFDAALAAYGLAAIAHIKSVGRWLAARTPVLAGRPFRRQARRQRNPSRAAVAKPASNDENGEPARVLSLAA